MSHTKLVLPSAWDFGLATAELVKVAQGRLVGTDYGILVKRAGEEFAHLVRNMSIAPDELPVHIIAMGATEAYGPNRNADGFKAAMLQRTHKTFEKHAKVYRGHKNNDPSQSYGVIKFAFWNAPMKRVELLLGLNKNAEAARRNGGLVADKEIEKLASGKDMAGSMAIRVPYDVCSVCDHKARHRGEYCESVKEGGSCPGFGCKQGLARVLENGHIQHVDNPDGVFFDYSHVHKPADRNAYGNIATYLQKAAAAGRELGGSELAELLEVTTPLWLRTGELEPWIERQVKIAYQLAEIETVLEADIGLLQQAAPAFLPAEPLDLAPLGTLGSEKSASGLAALASQQILLPLSEFVCWLVGGDREKAAELTSAVSGSLPGIYSRLIASGSLEADIAGSPFRPSLAAVPPAQRHWAAKCAAAYSWTAPAVFQRAARSAIHNLAPAAITVKRAGVAEKWRGVAGQVEALACHYALYKLAALAAQSQELPLTAHFAACQNYIVR